MGYTLTKGELIEALKDFPDDAQIFVRDISREYKAAATKTNIMTFSSVEYVAVQRVAERDPFGKPIRAVDQFKRCFLGIEVKAYEARFDITNLHASQRILLKK